MGPVIRISDANFERLKEWAVPLEDSVDDALGKALAAAEQHKSNNILLQDLAPKSTLSVPPVQPSFADKPKDTQVKNTVRLHKGEGTPMKDFKVPILEVLKQLGGRGRSSQVLELVERQMRPRLKDVDYQTVPSGAEIRWHKKANWARYILVEEGLLKSDSERGVWELA